MRNRGPSHQPRRLGRRDTKRKRGVFVGTSARPQGTSTGNVHGERARGKHEAHTALMVAMPQVEVAANAAIAVATSDLDGDDAQREVTEITSDLTITAIRQTLMVTMPR